MTVAIGLFQYNTITSSTANTKVFVNEHQQKKLATRCFIRFALIALLHSFGTIASFYLVLENELSKAALTAYLIINVLLFFSLALTVYAPIIFSTCVADTLGAHLENFSKFHIDTLYDKLAQCDNTSAKENASTDEDNNTNKQTSAPEAGVFSKIKYLLVGAFRFMASFVRRLGFKRYPKLPEMQITKLSTSLATQMTDDLKIQNSNIVRLKLELIQVILADLRDIVNEINFSISILLIFNIFYATLLVIVTTTASINARAQTSSILALMPAVLFSSALASLVINICVSFDKVPSELDSMMNKIFDFIVINHREEVQTVRSRGRGVELSTRAIYKDEALSETWSQFQYARKLANSINFNMAGVLPLTKRVVFVILAYILSSIFISIEMMSIVDTTEKKPMHLY